MDAALSSVRFDIFLVASFPTMSSNESMISSFLLFRADKLFVATFCVKKKKPGLVKLLYQVET